VLLAVLPFAAASVVLQIHWWAVNAWPVAVWAAGLSLLLALVAMKLRAVTLGGAFCGGTIAACLILSTASFSASGATPGVPWRTALTPLLAVFALTTLATRLGRQQKELCGTAERREGRTAAQVAANLGMAAIAAGEFCQGWIWDAGWFSHANPALVYAASVAALAEAAADTVSSELGQVLGGQPRMLTTLRRVEPGTDGAVSLIGTLAGLGAAAIVAGAGALAVGGGMAMFWIACAGGVFGLFFDSLLGATLERRGWLTNDAVNFLSTGSAAGFALGAMASFLRQ
jgi:uncharacterized protein (TIGR00297 family)